MHLCEHTQPDTCSITGLWTLSMWPTVFLLAENLIHQRHPAKLTLLFFFFFFFFFIKLTLKFFGFSNWMWICCYLKNSECWWWTKTPNNCWWQDLSWTLTNAKSTSWLERKLEIVYELFTQKCWCLCFISIKAKEWNSLYNILILHQL